MALVTDAKRYKRIRGKDRSDCQRIDRFYRDSSGLPSEMRFWRWPNLSVRYCGSDF